MWDGWNHTWDHDRCRETCLKYPFANLGLLLGDIVDVEGDTEEANSLLARMVANHPHPVFRSSKSIHHLFLSPDSKLTARRFNDIEFRGHKHQSVIPPSLHEDGNKYVWLGQTRFPIPPMPDALLEYYQRHTLVSTRPRIKPGHMRPWCSVCAHRKYIHRKRYLLEVDAFRELGLRWQCWLCRQIDLRDACRRLRAQH